MKRGLGIVFLAVSVILFIFSFRNVTGFAVGFGAVPISYFLSLIFFVFGLVLFVSGRTLDAIIVPTGTYEADLERAEVAARAYRNGRTRKLIISGRRHDDAKLGMPQVDRIHAYLLEHGVKEEDIEKEYEARDTVDNVIYSSKFFPGKRIGVATYRDHFNRFKLILKYSKKEGLIHKDVEFVPILTNEGIYDEVYEWGIDANKFGRKFRIFIKRLFGRWVWGISKSSGGAHAKLRDYLASGGLKKYKNK